MEFLVDPLWSGKPGARVESGARVYRIFSCLQHAIDAAEDADVVNLSPSASVYSNEPTDFRDLGGKRIELRGLSADPGPYTLLG